ncbi:MAG: hypothetical protein ABIF08_02000 [Nanoarchaeota archaeon]
MNDSWTNTSLKSLISSYCEHLTEAENMMGGNESVQNVIDFSVAVSISENGSVSGLEELELSMSDAMERVGNIDESSLTWKERAGRLRVLSILERLAIPVSRLRFNIDAMKKHSTHH